MNVDMRNELASFFAHMRESREKGRFTDVIVVCNDQTIFRCHQMILAATSDYFDTKLGTNVCQTAHVNLPLMIPGHIFRVVLTYMYTGTVTFLNETNVYDLLIASNVLRMGTIEKACRHYLSQKGIPRLWFSRIFKFACSTDDPSLQFTVCRFALKDKHDELLSEVTPSEFQVLVSHFQAASPAEEASMVERILKWTLPSSGDTQSREQVRFTFMNSVKLFAFEYLPLNYAGQYFENMVANEDCPVHLREGVSWSVSDQHSALLMFSQSRRTPMKLCTLAQNGGHWKWQSLNSYIGEGVVLCGMRCTVVGGRPYWLLYKAPKECDGRKIQIEFRSSPCVDPFVHSTVLPSLFSDVPPTSAVHMCSDDKSTIFACTSNSNTLVLYDCELQQWSDLNLGNSFFPRTMTWYDRQLYILGAVNPTSTVNVLRSLDLRSHRSVQAWGPVDMYAARFECTSHKERLYLASFCNSPSGMMIFDPIAGKAINVKMPQMTFDDECRLASFQDNLYTVNCDTKRSVRVDIFEPYSQTFENVPVDSVIDPESYLLDVAVFKQCLSDWSDMGYPSG